MFRLRALRRACRKHSFIFNPLAARPVQLGETKPGCIYPLNRIFFLPVVLCRQLADPRKGRWEAGIPIPALILLVVLAWVNPFTPQTQILMLSKANAFCLFVCVKAVTGNPQAGEHPEQRAVPEQSAVVFINTMSHGMTLICPIPLTPDP